MRKHLYQVKLNQGRILRNPILATFGRSGDIQLHICHDGILIMLCSTAEKNGQEILSGEDALFADATRKALTIHTIRYGRFLNVTLMEILIDGVQQQTFRRRISEPPLIYSLSEGKLRIPFGEAWRKTSIESSIAYTSKSNYDGRFSALYALMAAKSDRYEIERFTYYWMAMNGLYNFVAALGEKMLPINSKGKKLKLDNETEKQRFFLRCYGVEACEFDQAQNKEEKTRHERHLQWPVCAVLKSIPNEEIDAFCTACLTDDTNNRYLSRILSTMANDKVGFDYHFSVISFMVIWLPYKLRCKSFHGENALPTFCYKDDPELKVLRVINRLIDRFLTLEMVLWLNMDDASEAKRQRMLNQAAENHAYDKWRS